MTNQERGDAFEGIGCGLIMVTIILIIIVACSGLIQMTNKLHQEALDKQTTIEGTVSSIECYNIPEPKEPPPEKGKTRITIGGKAYNPEKTKITFQDGRSKEFNGIPPKPLNPNKYYTITYNGYNEITETKEKE